MSVYTFRDLFDTFAHEDMVSYATGAFKLLCFDNVPRQTAHKHHTQTHRTLTETSQQHDDAHRHMLTVSSSAGLGRRAAVCNHGDSRDNEDPNQCVNVAIPMATHKDLNQCATDGDPLCNAKGLNQWVTMVIPSATCTSTSV